MIHDGYAAGLPFVAAAIPFVRDRASADHAGVVLPVNDAEPASRELATLDAERATLIELPHRARAAGLEHAVENGCRRRAAWTVEAVERKRGTGLAPMSG